ncbi:hypothetical protein GQF56_19100 [Rhodobacter sphaeroides]|uniref:protein phosphatase 2C domain-containing protein n=2 Tax=Cereibacter sphaeroides TaxID=1063 RepID=UPI0009B603DF|nr:protein phosphatase 2C domain-containing protein [Cereibacter sphaeroides]AXC62919.1 hypothetical protein DQL45_16055 [Cereibacter sphaeroides 2.4.1]MVX49965.1 hypothetical protein [Cereibacter sphaeroides]QHA11699.1 hypothetical protein GQR99_16055 [Cereibacter sphaeroides]QHA14633.1 hypothetical protein GQY06_16025 [Cereibacter sphaeroides]QJC86446.1 protein phosphatase 2C domain-containing protein [Cereibacter sphaeroides]
MDKFANETYFLTARDAVERFRLSAMKLQTPVSILLASDGAAVSLLKRSDNAVAPAVTRLCEWTAARPRKEMNAALKSNLEGMFRRISPCRKSSSAGRCPRSIWSIWRSTIS